MSIRRFLISIFVGTLLAAGCSKPAWKVEEIGVPAGPNSSVPYFSAARGFLWMSWIEQTQNGPVLKCAWWNGNWNEPATITSSPDLFVNWADFPSILALSNGTLAAHWLQKSGQDKYAYDVVSAISKDRGITWSRPSRAHQDQTESEHGFVSLTETADDQFSAVWLDARNYKTSQAMSLMYATFQNLQFRNETLIDPRVCDCCQTGTARIPGGLFVIYRDRSKEEIRDISYVRFLDGKWSSPKSIHSDGWKIHGCPVNGPAAASLGNKVAVAWYTGANDHPRVYAAFSKNAGESFTSPIRVDSGNPFGRVDIEMLEDGSAVVSWMENHTQEDADIRVRNVFADGRSSAPMIAGKTTNARSSGVPRMAVSANNIFIAWTDSSRIRIAKISL